MVSLRTPEIKCYGNNVWSFTTGAINSLTAIFSSVTQTQTRTQLARVWLEYESSGITLSVSGVWIWYAQPSLNHHSPECQIFIIKQRKLKAYGHLMLLF